MSAPTSLASASWTTKDQHMPGTWQEEWHLRLAWKEETPPAAISRTLRSRRLGAEGGVAAVGEPPWIWLAYAQYVDEQDSQSGCQKGRRHDVAHQDDGNGCPKPLRIHNQSGCTEG
jgi:hypothetical protein